VPAVTHEQLRPERLLELVDLVAERGLGDVEARGGAAEVELLRNGQEVAQQARFEIDRARLSLPWETGLGHRRAPDLASVVSATFGTER
jgi:hypothetical protein